TNNVNLFLDKVNTVNIDSIDYKKSNYSYLLKSDLSHLKDNINNNINEYIEQVLLKLNNTEEEYEVIKGLINNPEIKEENIDLLIEKLNFKILDISEIENERFWSTLVIWEKIEPNWKNVLLFYESESENIDSNLIDFLDNESNFKALSENCINDFVNDIDQIDEKYLKLIDRFNVSLVNSKISDEAFEALVYSMTRQFDDIKLIEKSERIKKLIELNLIVFNEQNLSDLKTNDLMLLIEANEKSLNAQYEFLDLRISRWSAIFLSNINGETKKKIFDYLTKRKIYASNDDIFLSIVMKNLFDGKFHSFSDYFIKSALESLKIDKRLKIKLLVFEKDNLTEPLLNDFIKLLGEPYSLVIQKEKFEIFNSSENQDFFKILKQHGFIKRTYTKDKDSILTVSYN
ncbi:TPA: hypothetical protein L3254_002873, partial [Elizabethkingia anophelis]|nr:hypothetical protein [Elizabethkingia anophelis]